MTAISWRRCRRCRRPLKYGYDVFTHCKPQGDHNESLFVHRPSGHCRRHDGSGRGRCRSGGTAGDLITCRPFYASLELYKAGHLASLNDLEGLNVAKSAWTTDDGAVTFCLPMASVIHGFFYNKEAFEEVGVDVPDTLAEFKAVLDKFNADGTYTPLAMGTNDQWEAATMGFQNVGPNFWKGEEGRRALPSVPRRCLNSARLSRRCPDPVTNAIFRTTPISASASMPKARTWKRRRSS